jgi:transposase
MRAPNAIAVDAITVEPWRRAVQDDNVDLLAAGRRMRVPKRNKHNRNCPGISGLIAVAEGGKGLSIRQAAEALNVSKSTIHDDLSGKRTESVQKKDSKKQAGAPEKEPKPVPSVEASRETFGTIVIDPPWPMARIERDVRPNRVEVDRSHDGTCCLDILRWGIVLVAWGLLDELACFGRASHRGRVGFPIQIDAIGFAVLE